ncbi:hypothetical protein Bca4012_101822 [Brassica carinata]
MTNPEIVDKVINIAREQLGVDDYSEVTAQSTFVDDLGADDLAIREFVLALEEAFEIEIEDEKVQSISTVGQAAEVIEELLK